MSNEEDEELVDSAGEADRDVVIGLRMQSNVDRFAASVSSPTSLLIHLKTQSNTADFFTLIDIQTKEQRRKGKLVDRPKVRGVDFGIKFLEGNRGKSFASEHRHLLGKDRNYLLTSQRQG